MVNNAVSLINEFEIKPGDKGQPWHASNGPVDVTAFASEHNKAPSKSLGAVPALLFKANRIHRAGTPDAYKEQWLVAELNGVFVHLKSLDGRVSVIVADHRLG